jgi:ATP-binding cassette subfamily B protein
VLKEISFDLKRGETLGFVGRTGSGKSTLSRLLLREFDLTDGDIQIDGRSIYDYKIDSLRQTIGYVPQDHFLFSTTIAENIAFAKPEASMEEIREVAALAYIDRDIMQFPDGYGTIVGERGTTLSGGQKQRISIARALLLNSEILILDDALSAVDAKTEKAILKNLLQLREGKTTIIASHRISSLSHANLIIVLENGEVVERGTHQQLITHDGWYKEIYTRQQLEQQLEQGGELNV